MRWNEICRNEWVSEAFLDSTFILENRSDQLGPSKQSCYGEEAITRRAILIQRDGHVDCVSSGSSNGTKVEQQRRWRLQLRLDEGFGGIAITLRGHLKSPASSGKQVCRSLDLRSGANRDRSCLCQLDICAPPLRHRLRWLARMIQKMM
jgi:hypothetical protein